MTWVLLSLRATELQRLHSDYVAEDLKITRTERQMSRYYQYEQAVVLNSQKKALDVLSSQYNADRTSLYDQIKQYREDQKNTGTDHSTDIQLVYEQLNQLKLDYDESVNSEKTFWEGDLELLEEESKDIETQYEQDKIRVETQMEAVAQELQAVKQSISQQIQNETIKIS